MHPATAPATGCALSASYFDGQSAREHVVTLTLSAQALHIQGDGITRAVALRDVQWPERTRHGLRVAHLQGGGSVQCQDASAWDHWRQTHGHRESWVVRMQQNWRGVLASVLVLIGLAIVLQQWGIPVAARAIVAAIPHSAEVSLGESSLEAIDDHLMRPSKLPPHEQERIRQALTQAFATLPPGSLPAWRLVFRQSKIGPNAFALPGGTLVLTDELVELVDKDTQVITAVMAHEIGHVQHRHGVRLLVQATVLGGLSSVVLGDFSTLLAGVPVLLGQASYSRDAEREADAQAVQILRAAGISPAAMVTLFDKLEAQRKKEEKDPSADHLENSWLGIAFGSHPGDAERVRYFQDAARTR